jgi:hypothetical protein
MPQGKPPLPNISSPFQRYGLAVLSVAIALGIALLLERYHFRGVEFPLFLFAIALTVWYAGLGPAILAVIFSSLAFDYFFTKPLYSLYVRRSDLPYYIVFRLQLIHHPCARLHHPVPMPQQLPQITILPARYPDPRKIIFQQQSQNQLRILAIRLLLAYPLRTDLGRVPDPQLKLQFRE